MAQAVFASILTSSPSFRCLLLPMKTLCGIIVLASLCAALAVDPTPADHTAWQKFKVQYLKKYPTKEEEDKRFIIFVGNLRRAEQLNNDEPHADFGVTKFSDLRTEEFRTRLGHIRSSDAPRKMPLAPRVQVDGALPDSIDWTKRATTPVKDQGNCGSCWAFSATEQIESDFMVQKNASVILGVQEMVDCTAGGLPRFGCLGGEPYAAYKVVQKLGGMELEKDYPYRGMLTIPTCHLKKEKLAVTVDDWAYVGKNDETEMKKYVGTSGTLSVCVNAGSWHSYRSGVMTNCPSRSTDHCVQIVGYGKTSDGLEYWKVRNSWGTNFGEEGFLRVALGSNQCDINSEATKTTAGHVISVQDGLQVSSIVV